MPYMPYVEMSGGAGARDNNPDHVRYGAINIAQTPGLAEQADDGACLQELKDIADSAPKASAGPILKNTVQTDGEIVPGNNGSATRRLCGRSACTAECVISVGAWYWVEDIATDETTAPETHCQAHPVRRQVRRALAFFGGTED